MTELLEGDAFFELAQDVNNVIAERARQLFEDTGANHGQDLDNWLKAKSEVLLNAPLEISETETELIVRADVPGCSEGDLEVRLAPRSLCVTGTRPEPSDRVPEETTFYSERNSKRIFRIVGLSSEVDADNVRATVANGVLEVRLVKIGLGKKIPVMAKAAGA
jgi:HSP20 family protein